MLAHGRIDVGGQRDERAERAYGHDGGQSEVVGARTQEHATDFRARVRLEQRFALVLT